MKYFSFIALLFLLIPYVVIGQIVSKGYPRLSAVEKADIPILILPDVNIRQLQKEDKKHTKSRLKSMRFAKIIEVDINPEVDGKWETLPDGDRLWYFKIKSPGAYSLSILFDNYRLPIGSKLYVYSSDQKHVRGSFTYKNNKWNNLLPIAPVKGDEIIIEYFEPANVEFKGELHISSVAHDYIDVFKYLSKGTKGFGDSGDCNININCDNDEMWQLLKHSVCKITYNGWLCSGALINNTNQDETPYLLTANHCISNDFDASAAVFYFNYESIDCSDIDGTTDQTIAGSSIIATPTVKTLDFSLLELSLSPPSNYKPFYAGWNRDVANPTSVTSIHHPQGDIKKITKSYDGATTGDYGEGYNEYAHWYIDEWDEGTTEGGSSGSPLFDQNGRIIGDLTGGDANCSYNFNDYYQQLHHSWQDFSDSSYQLKPWLDPKNSELVFINGYLPYDTIPSNLKAMFADTVVYLSWNDVVDTSLIEFYYIYRNSVKVDSLKDVLYTDTLAYKNKLYKYLVTAKYKWPYIYESESSNVVYVRTMNPLGLPFKETFEDQTFIPDDWYEERSNDTIGWRFKSGSFEGITDTAFEGSVNAYFYNDNSETSKLVLPKFDFTLYTNVKLSFYLLMQEFNNDVHHLKILYKNSDSLEWSTLRKYDTNIEEWTKKEVSLPELSDKYQIAFEGIGLRGFGICIDSITLIEDGKFIDVDFITNKDTICIYDSIQFSTTIDDKNDFFWDFGISASPQTAIGAGPHWVNYTTAGIKPALLKVNDTYIKQDNEVVIVFDSPEMPSFLNSGDKLISSSEMGNQWHFNGQPIVGAMDNTYMITKDGYYSVEVTNSFGCSSHSINKYMLVNDIEEFVEKDVQGEIIRIFPNPNNGSFILKINTTILKDEYVYDIIDITGKVLQTGNVDLDEASKYINLFNAGNGVYFIKIYSEQNYYTSKILIKK
ncbi:trypsin-like peptidase domain-containing protein [Bacteroidota bacterium]